MKNYESALLFKTQESTQYQMEALLYTNKENKEAADSKMFSKFNF
jgi:hypothetical protein